MEDLDIPRGAVELFPYLRHPCKASRAFGLDRKPAAEPIAHGVEAGFQRGSIGAPERVAERMHGRGIEGGEKLNRAAGEVEEFNLERKPLVFAAFGLLAEAARG